MRIKDYSGNYIVTYYYYDVASVNVVNGIQINSTLAKSTNLESGEKLDLPTPTVSLSVGEEFEVFGLAAGDSKEATNYRVVLKSTDNPAEHEFTDDNQSFVAYNTSAYTYKFAYETDVMIFNPAFGFAKDEYGVKLTANGYYMNRLTKNANHDGDYVLVKGSTEFIEDVIYGVVEDRNITFYKIASAFNGKEDNVAYVEHDNVKYFAEINEDGKLAFVSQNGNKNDYITAEAVEGNLVFTGHGAIAGQIKSVSLSGLETESIVKDGTSTPLTTSDFTITTLTSDLYYVTVKDSKAPVLTVDYNYDKTADKGSVIYIDPIKAEDKSAYFASGIDAEASYVQISFSGKTETGNDASFSENKWTIKDWHNAAGYQADGDYKGSIKYTIDENKNGTYKVSYFVVDNAGNGKDTAAKTFEIAVGDVANPTITLGKDFLKDTYKVGEELTIDLSKITLGDNVTSKDKLMEKLSIKLTNTTTNEEVENLQAEDSGFYSFKVSEVGTYKVEISVKDEAGWKTTKTVEFEVETSTTNPNVVSTVVGIVLVVVAVLILGGVVTYFVVSKIKLDKELKKGKNK